MRTRRVETAADCLREDGPAERVVTLSVVFPIPTNHAVGMEEVLLIDTLLVGVVVVLSIGMRYGAEQVRVSPIVGYFVLGILLRAASSLERVPLLTEQQVFPFLADLGVIVLLFRVGLESDLERLLDQLPEASWIGLGNVLGSGGIAFLTAYNLIGWSLLPSLFVATALTATSVGVTVAIWEEAGQVDPREGATLPSTRPSIKTPVSSGWWPTTSCAAMPRTASRAGAASTWPASSTGSAETPGRSTRWAATQATAAPARRPATVRIATSSGSTPLIRCWASTRARPRSRSPTRWTAT